MTVAAASSSKIIRRPSPFDKHVFIHTHTHTHISISKRVPMYNMNMNAYDYV